MGIITGDTPTYASVCVCVRWVTIKFSLTVVKRFEGHCPGDIIPFLYLLLQLKC